MPQVARVRWRGNSLAEGAAGAQSVSLWRDDKQATPPETFTAPVGNTPAGVCASCDLESLADGSRATGIAAGEIVLHQ